MAHDFLNDFDIPLVFTKPRTESMTQIMSRKVTNQYRISPLLIGQHRFIFDVGGTNTVNSSVDTRPETISWTMFALAIILAVPLERFGAELPWGMPLVGQACICAAAITALEFVTGLVLNVWLGLGVWDYSHLAGNILGQICPQFTLLWLVLSVVGIVILDWMRYAVEGGKKPHYT